MESIANVLQGSLRGKQCVTYSGKKFYSFEGIPYARPPVGELRFRDPQEPDSWSGIRDATKPGNKCIQMDPYGTKGLTGSEDCLYLNVYTPSLPAEKIEKLPVLFFVHGGRLLVGHGDYYKPDYFLDHDVVLVTINYRLHVVGFLCLHTEEVPGNAAFKDTVVALRWVKKNIINFNGDPDNLTAFGESAGAAIVTSYLITKMADGLFNKIIAESGMCLSDMMIIEQECPIEKARGIASILGKDISDIKQLHDFLLNAPIEELVYAATVAEVSRPKHMINANFLPVVEKVTGVQRYFVERPYTTFMKNEHKKVPILIGQQNAEGALFLSTDEKGQTYYIKDLQLLVPRYLHLKYDSDKCRRIARKLYEHYFKGREIGDETRMEYVNLFSDTFFNRDLMIFTEILSENSDVFYYNFCYAGNMNTRVMKRLGLEGAAHSDILQYQFYKKYKHDGSDEGDRTIVNFLSEAWCNFAKNGKPKWRNQRFEWLPYKAERRLCVNVDREIELVRYPYWDRIKCWLDAMGDQAKL